MIARVGEETPQSTGSESVAFTPRNGVSRAEADREMNKAEKHKLGEQVRKDAPQPSRRNLMNVSQVAEYLGTSESKIYKMTSKKMIPHIKLTSRQLAFIPDEIDQWILDHRVVTPEQLRR